MTDWTAADLPAFTGRTVIVTGANSGLGLVTTRELARVGAHVVLAVRNTAKGDDAASGMSGSVEVRKLDLQDLASVQEFADGVTHVDVLVDNAGIMAVPYAETVDGFESQIGTNHLGHFALTNLLLPKVTDRVVTISSMFHWMGRIDLADLNWKQRRYHAWLAYAQSKLANLLFTSELQDRLDRVGSSTKALAAHPGYSATNLSGHPEGWFQCGVRAGGRPPGGHRRRLRRSPDALRRVAGVAGQHLRGSTVRNGRTHAAGGAQPAGSPIGHGQGVVAAIRAA